MKKQTRVGPLLPHPLLLCYVAQKRKDKLILRVTILLKNPTQTTNMAIGNNFFSPYGKALQTWNSTRPAYRSGVSTQLRNAYRYGASATTTGVLRKRPTPGYSTNSLAAKVRKLQPANHVNVGDNVATFTMLHNTVFTWNLLSNVISGAATENQRSGNQLFLEAVKLSFFCESPTTIDAITVRVMILMHDDFYDNAVPSSVGLTRGDIGIGTTGNERTTCLIPDPKKCTIIDDRKFVISVPVSGARDTTIIDYNVQLKQKFLFQTSSTQEGKFKNLYCVITANQCNAPNGTIIGVMKPNFDLIFRE